MNANTHECIPVYHPDGRLYRWLSSAELYLMKNVRLCQNKRGYVHRAYLTGNDVMRPLVQGNAGETYEEPCGGHKIWAMKLAPVVR